MSPKTLLVSFIIPVYNASAFIEDAYQNILNQKVSNIEILFIDNNSIDNTVNIISEIIKKDNRVKLFFEKKQGASAARNRGILEASGAYIHFYDADDLLYDNAILSLIEVLENNAKVMSVFGNMTRSSNRILNSDSNKGQHKKFKIYKKQSDLTYLWLKDRNKLVGPPGFLHRRSVVKKTGGFREDLLVGEDAFFHIRLSNEFELAHIDTNIYHYFRHSNSTVSIDRRKQKPRVFRVWPALVNVYLPYLLDKPVTNRFKNIVYSQVYGAMGKMLLFTNASDERKKLLSNRKKDIAKLKTPFLINLFLKILVLMPNNTLYKFYSFYIVRKIYHEKK